MGRKCVLLVSSEVELHDNFANTQHIESYTNRVNI